MTMVPATVMGGIELLLRLSGVGYPTTFFLATERDGNSYLVENPRFGWRFFPSALSRAPLPTVIRRQKPADTRRVFVFGGSATKGEPEPAFGFTRVLEVLLDARFPDLRFEVINVGVTAINSHVVVPIARECAALDGDVWVIYLGNNEVLGPFGPGGALGSQTSSLTLLRAGLAVKTTRIGQLLDRGLSGMGAGGDTPKTWRGMEMFLERQFRHDDPRLEIVYEQFSSNLDDIVEVGLASGAQVIATTMVSNLRDCAPFASLNSPALGKEGEEAWKKNFEEGARQQATGELHGAIEAYQRAAALDSSHAELHFRMGWCYWSTRKFEAARRAFVRARDLDAIRLRADSRTNRIIREVAVRRPGEGLHLLDAARSFAGRSPNGVTGREHFYEHVHFTFKGSYVLARLLAERVAEILPGSTISADLPGWLSDKECARRLALTAWDYHDVNERVRKRLSKAPYSRQLNHGDRDRLLEEQNAGLASLIRASGLKGLAAVYHQAIVRDPDDWFLHDRFGHLLAAYGEDEAAEKEWRRVIQLVPHHVLAHYSLGFLRYDRGRLDDAEKLFRETIRLRADFPAGHRGLGLVFAGRGEHETACEHFARALEISPFLVDARVEWGRSLIALGEEEAAISHLREALRVAPDHELATKSLREAEERRSSRTSASDD
ncbi:MAG: tetratricopeptide repeat protein [Planctomycetota bacterium]|nr:tetratricopeptide repeat protein [Planctomycetota bacterium]